MATGDFCGGAGVKRAFMYARAWHALRISHMHGKTHAWLACATFLRAHCYWLRARGSIVALAVCARGALKRALAIHNIILRRHARIVLLYCSVACARVYNTGGRFAIFKVNILCLRVTVCVLPRFLYYIRFGRSDAHLYWHPWRGACVAHGVAGRHGFLCLSVLPGDGAHLLFVALPAAAQAGCMLLVFFTGCGCARRHLAS